MAFGSRLVMPAKEVRKLHSKTMIFDVNYPYPEKHKALTVTGSYNFSAAAEKANDENILMIFDNKIANQFYQDFMGVLSRAKGETFHHYPSVDTTMWYDRFRVVEGDKVELETNVYYPVELLGVDAPRIWGGHEDSTYFHSAKSKQFLDSILDGTEIRITGGRGVPRHKYGSHKGYVTARNKERIFDVNQTMISTGNAQYSEYYFQPADKSAAYQAKESLAKSDSLGMWKTPKDVGRKVMTDDAELRKTLFPLNVNLATKKELQFLPTIGPGRADAIIAHRESVGFFTSLDDLDDIPGIGPATLKKLAPLVVFE